MSTAFWTCFWSVPDMHELVLKNQQNKILPNSFLKEGEEEEEL